MVSSGQGGVGARKEAAASVDKKLNSVIPGEHIHDIVDEVIEEKEIPPEKLRQVLPFCLRQA